MNRVLLRRREQAGFTLIELLVVIALISILAAMAVVQYRNSIQRAQEAVLKTNLVGMRDAIDQYYADKGKYPASLDALVSEQYLRRIPEDPFTKSSDTWQTIPAEPDPGNPSAEPGIYDVKSGAQGTALDGTSFSDWQPAAGERGLRGLHPQKYAQTVRPAADDTSGIVASHSLVPDALVHAFGTFGTLMPPNLPLIGAPTPLRSRAARQPLKLDS